MTQNLNSLKKVLLHIDFSEEFGRMLLKGISCYGRLKGPWVFCRLPLQVHTKGSMKTLLITARELEVDGIIGNAYGKEDIQLIEEYGIPFIAIDYLERTKEIPVITGNYLKTGELAAQHLLERGFENYAYYGRDTVWSREREEGFTKTLKEYNKKICSRKNSETQESFWFFKPSPLSNWLELLPKPCGIMASDDNNALSIIESCVIAGIKVPEDIAIIGVDNDETICNLFNPPITSVAIDVEKGGFEAAAELDKMMANNSLRGDDIVLQPSHIVTRQSTDIIAIEDKILVNAIYYIRQQANKDITVEDVVAEVPLSRRSLEKKFVVKLNSTIQKEIHKSKMKLVASMLRETNLSVQEVAWNVEISDAKNLSRTFKAYYGMTPIDYRNRNKNFTD